MHSAQPSAILNESDRDDDVIHPKTPDVQKEDKDKTATNDSCSLSKFM